MEEETAQEPTPEPEDQIQQAARFLRALSIWLKNPLMRQRSGQERADLRRRHARKKARNRRIRKGQL